MTLRHQPVIFTCVGSELVGIIEHAPEPRDTGVLIVTGGPQYRAGSHRQFVSIARTLANGGYTTMRFDYRGMGDSAGPEVIFHETSTDIEAAIDAFLANTTVKRVVLWGLCDAASAALIYAHDDARVVGLVLLNPWVRTEEGLAQVYVKKYYLNRLLTREFWRKLGSGGWEWRTAAREFVGNVTSTVRLLVRSKARRGSVPDDPRNPDFRERMRIGLDKFSGKVLFLLCGNDLTAAEFLDYAKQSRDWHAPMACSSVTQICMPEMDHTFSTTGWRNDVVSRTMQWLEELTSN